MPDIHKIDGVSPNDFTVGDNSASDKSIKFKTGDINPPGFMWDESETKNKFSNNGTDFFGINETVIDQNVTTGVVGGMVKIYTCTQAEYSAIAVPDHSTLYLIREV